MEKAKPAPYVSKYPQIPLGVTGVDPDPRYTPYEEVTDPPELITPETINLPIEITAAVLTIVFYLSGKGTKIIYAIGKGALLLGFWSIVAIVTALCNGISRRRRVELYDPPGPSKNDHSSTVVNNVNIEGNVTINNLTINQ